MSIRDSNRNRKIAFWSYAIGGILLSISSYFLLQRSIPDKIFRIKGSILVLFTAVVLELWVFKIDPWIRSKLENKFHVTILNGFPWKIVETDLRTKYYLILCLQVLLFYGFIVLTGLLFSWIIGFPK